MRNYLSRVPFGVWFGCAVLLFAAKSRDEMGLALGAILVVVTLITTSKRDQAREKAAARTADDSDDDAKAEAPDREDDASA